jgi:putative oxidoreductase
MKRLLHDFPFIDRAWALFIFRVALAAVFVGHAAMRLLVPDYFAKAGKFLEANGLPFGYEVAWIVTIVELIGGPLLVFNRFVKWVALCFFFISVASMAFVQHKNGWWVAEFSDGGMEFSFVVCAMCVFIATVDRQSQSSQVNKFFQDFPYLSVNQGYFILRLGLALFFMIHAVTRFTRPNYFAGLGAGLEHFGMPQGYALGVMATAIELVGGTLMIFNKFAKWVALGFFGISSMGIAYIHIRLGWFVGEFGNGGAEFSVAICATALVIAAFDRPTRPMGSPSPI